MVLDHFLFSRHSRTGEGLCNCVVASCQKGHVCNVRRSYRQSVECGRGKVHGIDRARGQGSWINLASGDTILAFHWIVGQHNTHMGCSEWVMHTHILESSRGCVLLQHSSTKVTEGCNDRLSFRPS